MHNDQIRRTEVAAHRGASAYAPEHTFAAYDLAVAMGADALELDVRATADGELVVLHDPTLERTADDPRAVAVLAAKELDALDPAVRPLRLDDVLERYAGETGWIVELKDPAPAWEAAVGAALARHGLRERAVVQSFDAMALRRLHVADPSLAVAPLCDRAPGMAWLRATARFATAVGVRHHAVDVGLVARARSCGLGVRAWTANDPADVDRLLALGVDGVITDAPDVALARTRRLSVPALAA